MCPSQGLYVASSFNSSCHKTTTLPLALFIIQHIRFTIHLSFHISVLPFFFWYYHHTLIKMGLFSRANDALNVNPTVGADIAITTHGSDWYWAATAVLGLSMFIFFGLSFTVPAAPEYSLHHCLDYSCCLHCLFLNGIQLGIHRYHGRVRLAY